MEPEPERYTVVKGKYTIHMTVHVVHDQEAVRRVEDFWLRCLEAKTPQIYGRGR